MTMTRTIAFCGSRHLPESGIPAVQVAVEQALQGEDWQIVAGCCVGVDACVIESVLSARGAVKRLHIFAAFGPDGAGSCGVSAVKLVQQAEKKGAQVTWFAGGEPKVPLALRLVTRTARVVEAMADAGGQLLACFTSPESAQKGGTHNACRRAAALGRTVKALTIGFDTPPRRLHENGEWKMMNGLTVTGATAWAWKPKETAE